METTVDREATRGGRRRAGPQRCLLGCAALLLTACGAGADPQAAPAATTPTADAAFPVTIEHKFGSTEIPEQPERVLSLGYTDVDPILALGTVPVAVRYWFGDQPNSIWPWAQDELNELSAVDPEVLEMPFGELDFEAIAALAPDLIIGVSAGFSQEEYDTLSEIAPTVSQSDAYVDFGVPWQEQTRVIGRSLGQEALALELVAETEALFEAARQEHPQFAGGAAAIASPADEGQFFFSGPEHERMRFLTSLGFELPDDLAQIAGEEFFGTISAEQLPLLDTDVLLWTIDGAQERAAIEDNPLYQQLDVTQEGRAVFLDTSSETDIAGPALVFSSVLSLPTVFDELVPQLAAAVDGDPVTEPTPASS